MAAKDDYLIDTLIELGYVTHEQVASVQPDAEASGEGVIDLLITRNIIPAAAVTQAKATYFHAEVVVLADMRLADEVVAAVPRHVAKRYRVVPVYRHDGVIGIALSDPSDLDTIDTLHHLLKLDIEPKVATDEDIEAALNKYYGAADDSVGKMIQDITEGEVEIGGRPREAWRTTARRWMRMRRSSSWSTTLIVEAFKIARFGHSPRAAGQDFPRPLPHRRRAARDEESAQAVAGLDHRRLKIQSNMSIAEKRIPQDGRIQTQVGGKLIDLARVVPADEPRREHRHAYSRQGRA